MKEKTLFIAGGIFLCMIFIGYQSCTHDPFINGNEMEPDTMIVDTMNVDTMDNNNNPDTIMDPDTSMQGNGDNPCDQDTVYFESQILPIFTANCALSGCHNAASAEDDVILISYASVISSDIIDAFDLEGSDLYEVLTEDDPDKRMPKPPASMLQQIQIDLIAKWILQGAKNLKCDQEDNGCGTDNVSYSENVKPVIDTYCISCHSGPAASGGVNLSNYNNVKTFVDNGRFFGAISWADGYQRMPQGSSQLDACILDKIKKWIDEGAQNN